MMIFEIVTLLICLLALIYYYWTWQYGYWQARGVPCVEAKFPFGSTKDVFLRKETIGQMVAKLCNTFKNERYIGFYAPTKPLLIVKDADLAKDIILNKFNNFYDNGIVVHDSVDLLFGLNPFTTKGFSKWKKQRGAITPSLTISKLKNMVKVIAKSSKAFTTHLKLRNGDFVEMKTLTRYFAVDAAVMCEFGIESESFTGASSQFSDITDGQLLGNSVEQAYAQISSYLIPWVARVFNLKTMTKSVENFFISITKSIIEQKEKFTTKNNDILQHLISVHSKAKDEGKAGFSDIEIAAHCMTFFLDATDTTGSELACILFEISRRPIEQELLRAEIIRKGKTIDDFDFEKLWSLEYLDMFISECMRFYPIIPVLTRICTKSTIVGDLLVEKGLTVFIAAEAIHNDPLIYPSPEEFIPERFSKANKSLLHKGAFLSFGGGPRMCIGYKYALTAIKIAIVGILLQFRLNLSPELENIKLGLDVSSSFLNSYTPKLWMKCEIIKE